MLSVLFIVILITCIHFAVEKDNLIFVIPIVVSLFLFLATLFGGTIGFSLVKQNDNYVIQIQP